MELPTLSSPHSHVKTTVTTVMLRVVYALIPGVLLYAYFFGWGVLMNLTLACTTAVAAEALMLKARGRPLAPFLGDLSVVVSGCLLALALPPLVPWWIPVVGTAFAVVIAKHLYGGLGYNPFNPAMVGYAMLLISFPREMTAWLPPEMLREYSLNLPQVLVAVFRGELPAGLSLDAITMATPLDALKTQLGLDRAVGDIQRGNPLFGSLGGFGWEWINAGFLLGGLWLIYKRVISWHIPASLILGMAAAALVFNAMDPTRYASPMFHVFTGATMLGAFFIATDPVTAATTPRGRILFGAGVGVLTYVIRTWGGYPDAIAFAVLLMNMVAPTIDHYTQPRVYGHSKD